MPLSGAQDAEHASGRVGRQGLRLKLNQAPVIHLLKLVETTYPPQTVIHLILGNHWAHISKET
jgi:hypothetical protein